MEKAVYEKIVRTVYERRKSWQQLSLTLSTDETKTAEISFYSIEFQSVSTTELLQLKWVVGDLPRPHSSGVLLADVTGDGIDEVILAGADGVVVLDGVDGHEVWSRTDDDLDDHVSAQMADLNNDGILEIIAPLARGVHVFHGNNGTTYWRLTGLSGTLILSSPVVFDIDGYGYPTIYVPVQDIEYPYEGTLNMISHDGQLLASTFVYRPCRGGLSLADADFDGEFEIYMGDRAGGLGGGLRSFWASNLTSRWDQIGVGTVSSHCPMIADVTEDGILDIIVCKETGSYDLFVVSAIDGSIIKSKRDTPGHYQPSVHDIDCDGNLEIMVANPFGYGTYDVIVRDLNTTELDAQLREGSWACDFGPMVADVTGDGNMEMIVVSLRNIYIYNKTFDLIYKIRDLFEDQSIDNRLQFAMANDIDGDGLNEVVIARKGGWNGVGYVYAWDTPAPTPTPRPRSEVEYYSEYRLGAAEYVERPGPKHPMQRDIFPSNDSINVDLNPTLSAHVWDYQWDEFNITFRTNASGVWEDIVPYYNIGRYPNQTSTGNAWGTYTASTNDMNQLDTTYYWSIYAEDSKGNSIEKIYHFTTLAWPSTCFKWSSSDDWNNGVSSDVYVRDGCVGIGGYDDFEDYSEGPLYGGWGERISSSWWTFSDYGGDMCLRHEGGVDSSRSMAITSQWGNVSDSTIQAKVINGGDDAMCYLQSRVAWEKNTMSSNCDSYGCRNDLRVGRDRFEIIEYDNGQFNVLSTDTGSVEGSVYQKMMSVNNGVYTDLYAKVWPVSGVEPGWQLVVTDEVTNGGAEDGCFAVSGFTDDVFYVSDFWLKGGYSNGSHVTEWKNAGQFVNWSTFNYVASDVFSGGQDIVITVQVSDDGLSVLDSMSFVAFNGNDEVDISGLPPAQYVRVVTNFMTTNETATAEISFYLIEFQDSPLDVRVSNPYPSNGAAGIPLTPVLHIDVNSSQGYQMNITWKYHDTDMGNWYIFGDNSSVSNGTYCQLFSHANSYDTVYYWSVNCSDGMFWTNETFHFTTLAGPSTCFNWSSSDDWKNGDSSQIYIRDGSVGIGGYDDFEDYSEGPLCGDWEERISSSWWMFYNYSGDMCLKHEADVDNSRSMAITGQWGNISDSMIQVKVINVGSSAMCYLQSRVAWEKNMVSSDCDFYSCRNDLRGVGRFEIVEYDDGVFRFLTYGSSGTAVSGSVYQKFMTAKNGVYTDLYAKIWPISDVEPSWQCIKTNEVTNGGAEDGCFGVFGYTDDVFYVSDFWLIGGYSSGSHTSKWKNADRYVNWSTLRYIASGVVSGSQDIVITVQVSDDGFSILDSLSFYVVNGDNEVDISSLLDAQYVRVVTNFTTTDETKTAEISFYSIDYQDLPLNIRVSNPYPSNGATSIPLTPTLHIDVNSSHGYQMDITWKYYDTDMGNWYIFGDNSSVSNGTYYQLFSNATRYNTLYVWKVEIDDGHGNWYDKTFSFTTSLSLGMIRNSKGNTWVPIGENIRLAIWDLNDTNGGTVWLPSGRFTIESTNWLISNLQIIGCGNSTVLITAPLCNANVFHAYKKNNITIRDLTINGNKYNQAAEQFQKVVGGIEKHNCGIMLERSKDCFIQNVNVFDIPNNGILVFDRCERIICDGCRVWECEWHGIEYWSVIADSTIVNCFARDCYNTPIVIELGGDPLTQFCTVENCVVTDDGTGNDAGIRVQKCYKINLVGNMVVNGNIKLSRGMQCNVVGNYIYNGGIKATTNSKNDNALISGNYIYDTPTHGISIHGNYTSVTGNYIYNTGGYGIYIWSASHSLFSDNFIIGCSQDAIYEKDNSCNFNYIVDNYLENNGGTIVTEGVDSVIGYNFGYG